MFKKVVFINSYQRSGSTLLGILLGLQKGLTYIGESRNLTYHIDNKSECYCGEYINNCEQWNKILDSIDPNDLKTDINSVNGFYFLKFASLFNPLLRLLVNSPIKRILPPVKIIENIISLYKVVSDISHSDTIVDSSHRTEHMKLLLPKLEENLKVIFLVRDGRAVVNSVLKRKNSTIVHEAKRWKRFHMFAKLSHLGINERNKITVRYEDLCNDPAKEIKRIGKFLDISVGLPTNLASHDTHFIGGSPTIKKTKLSNIKLDETWRQKWSQSDIQTFNKFAGQLNKSFGYKE